MKNVTLWLAMAVLMMASSCVPSSKFNALKEESDKRIAQLKQEKLDLKTANNELEYALENHSKMLQDIKEDTLKLGRELRSVKKELRRLQSAHQLLEQEHQALKSGKTSEMQAVLQELQTLKSDLLQREDRLNSLETTLSQKEQRLNAMQRDMEQKEQRLAELESILNRQDSVVSALKESVSKALFSFEAEGLSVEQKDGKVYLSLSEKLLFSSGSWSVESRGREAIQQIAGLLEKNPDINIMVEGHTDDVPYNGSGQIKDNWDLSVKRATSIVRIIIEGSNTDPARITAAGRSKYVPLVDAKTPEARRKNRRTEIILAPDLSELYGIIDQQD